MQLRISEWDKKPLAKNLSIQLTTSPDFLDVYINDNNAHVREISKKGMDFKESRHRKPEVIKDCLVRKEFAFVVEREGMPIEDCICPPPDPCPPDPAPPPPCTPNSNTKEPRGGAVYARSTTSTQNYTSVESLQSKEQHHHEDEEHHHHDDDDDKENVSGNVEGAVYSVFGLRRLGGIRRSLFHDITYLIRIPERNFKDGYNRFEIYSKNADGSTNLLLTTGVEGLSIDSKSSFGKGLSIQPAERQTAPNIERSEIDQLKNELEEVKKQLSEVKPSVTNQPANPVSQPDNTVQKTNPRTKS
jgi:hypothetical protein